MEREILGFVFCDEVLQQMLRDAAARGDVFNSTEIQAWRRHQLRIAPATDDLSGRTDTGTEAETTRASAVSVGQSEAGGRPREGRVEDNHDEDTATRPSGRVDDVADEPSLLAIGLQTAMGDFLEVVSSIKVGCHVSLDQVLDHLKKDDGAETYDLRQWLERMSANNVKICTTTIPRSVRQVAALRDKWGDSSQVLGKLDEVEKKGHLVPCIPSKEADEIRKLAGHNVSSSTSIFVLYLFEILVSGPCLR
jgi:hypothetical protein